MNLPDFHDCTLEQRKATFQNLFLIAAIDSYVDLSEHHLLMDFAQQLNLSKQDINEMLGQDNIEFIIPENKENCYIELQNVVMMMIADGKCDKREYDQCLKFALACGFSSKELDEMLDHYINWG